MPTTNPRALTPSSDSREEWLLDDAIDDTFPASDPVSHGQPGSLMSARYAALERAARRRRNATPWWLLLGGVVALSLMLVLRRRRDRDDMS